LVRPPVDTIIAPPFPPGERWVNTPPLEMEALRGQAVLLEFWDFARPNSLRTMPYLKAWHTRYGGRGLAVVGVHTPGFRTSANDDAVRAAVARLEVAYPVLLDSDYALWHEYENAGWPGRYLWNAEGALADYHYGEGAYEECERAICELLGIDCVPLDPVRSTDEPGAVLAPASEDRLTEPFSGPYGAGAAWAVLDPPAGGGGVLVNGAPLAVPHPGAYLLAEHERHSAGELELALGRGVRCDGVCFTPGLL
jgi:hypothetical protein